MNRAHVDILTAAARCSAASGSRGALVPRTALGAQPGF
jgi:hypothetical protein